MDNPEHEDQLENVCVSPAVSTGEGAPALPNTATINNTGSVSHNVIAGISINRN